MGLATGIPMIDSVNGLFGASGVASATFKFTHVDKPIKCAINPATISMSISRDGTEDFESVSVKVGSANERKKRKKAYSNIDFKNRSVRTSLDMSLVIDSFSELSFWDRQATRPNSFSKISGVVSSVKKASGGGSKLKEGLLAFVGESSYATILQAMNVNRKDGLLTALQIAYDQQTEVTFNYGPAFTNLKGKLTSLSSTFVMFSSNGDPIRADVGLSIELNEETSSATGASATSNLIPTSTSSSATGTSTNIFD